MSELVWSEVMHNEVEEATAHEMSEATKSALRRVQLISPAAARLYSMNSETANLRHIAAVISSDPTLSAVVLRMVNSPLFCTRQPVSSILQAVALLGLDTVRGLATTAALRLLVKTAAASPDLSRCWRHSIACALLAQDFASAMGCDRDAAYTAGLLHDIGRFAMLSLWPRKYSQLISADRRSISLQREFEELGVCHTDAGAYILEQWELPKQLVEVARQHHQRRPGAKSELIEIVRHACQAANHLLFTATPAVQDADKGDMSWERLISDQNACYLRIADGINILECH